MADDEEKQVRFFGRDIQKVPCFRTAFMNGIGSGLVGGLGYFLFTSNPKKAANFGFGAYLVGTLGFFTLCRYQWVTRKREQDLFKKALQTKILTEGTENSIEKQLERAAKEA